MLTATASEAGWLADEAMSPDQFTFLLAEIRGIKLALVVVGALLVVLAILGAVRVVLLLRSKVAQGLDEMFNEDAERMFQQADLDRLVFRCRERLEERPNHVYARWYLARAYYQKEEWSKALEQFEALRKLVPNWGSSIDPFVQQIRVMRDA